MSPDLAVVLKINVAGLGYTQIWRPLQPQLDVGTLDRSLPILDETGLKPVAYSATRVGNGTVLLSVACYWPGQTDEHGRPGLNYAYSLLCHFTSADPGAWQRVGHLLAAAYQRHLDEFDKLGEMVGRIARDESARGDIERLLEAPVDAGFQEAASLQGPGSVGADHKVYGLIRLLAEGTVMRVGGGMLSPRSAATYRPVASPKERPRDTRADVRPLRGYPHTVKVPSRSLRRLKTAGVVVLFVGLVVTIQQIVTPVKTLLFTSAPPAVDTTSYAGIVKQLNAQPKAAQAKYVKSLKGQRINGWTGSVMKTRPLSPDTDAFEIDVKGTLGGPEVEVRAHRRDTSVVRAGQRVKFFGVIEDVRTMPAGRLFLTVTSGSVESVEPVDPFFSPWSDFE